MRPVTVARNYAEALFILGERSGQAELYGELLSGFAAAVTQVPKIEAVLMSPRVTKAEKGALIAASLKDAPRDVVLFLQSVVKRGRQGLLEVMATEYSALLDQKLNRVRAGVTVARRPDPALARGIAQALSKAMGKEVIPSFYEDPSILGGVLVRVGDRIYDGSVRRRMTMLRRHLLSR